MVTAFMLKCIVPQHSMYSKATAALSPTISFIATGPAKNSHFPYLFLHKMTNANTQITVPQRFF